MSRKPPHPPSPNRQPTATDPEHSDEATGNGTDTVELSAFEQTLSELEMLVERMERGEHSLEEALRDFERGIQLTRRCQKTLQAAEQKVEILLENSEDADVGPFRPDDNPSPR